MAFAYSVANIKENFIYNVSITTSHLFWSVCNPNNTIFYICQESNEVLLRKARGILNKLCPQKFDILVDKFNELQIDTEDKLRVCMELVFEKVILI